MSSSSRRLSLCWLALMLLLKAALPWLAVGAAQAQGKTLVEVCTVYGVKTVVLDAAGEVRGDAADPGDSHTDTVTPASEHCALAGMVTHAAPGAATAALGRALPDEGLPPPATAPPRAALDATAVWAARLHRAPPFLN